MSAFFIFRPRYCVSLLIGALVLFVPVSIYADSCLPDRIDEIVKVDHVYDGDTLRLVDGRHIRIIGINTPEMGRDGSAPEALAVEARDALLSLLPTDQMISLRYGEERHDHYKRLLAHVFVNNRIDVGEHLLQRGLAVQIALPPNTWHLKCYREAEQRARDTQVGVWSTARYQPLHASDPGALDGKENGFHIVQGRVLRIKETKKSIWLILDGDVSLRIDRDDLHYFSDMDLLKLKNREIVVRGWLASYKNRPYIRIRHPIALQLEDS